MSQLLEDALARQQEVLAYIDNKKKKKNKLVIETQDIAIKYMIGIFFNNVINNLAF